MGEFLTSSPQSREILSFAGVNVVQHAGKWALEVAVPQPKAKFWLESQVVLCFEAGGAFCLSGCGKRMST